MIQKTHRNDNDVYNEMLTVLASDDHKQKFEQEIFDEDQIQGSSLKDKILSKMETALKSNPNDVVLNKVVSALKGQPSNISDIDLKFAVQAVKSDMDVAEELTSEEIAELGKLTGVPNFKADVSSIPKNPFEEYADKPVNPMEGDMYANPTDQLQMSKSTASILNTLIKIASYLGENNLLKSEAVADMLIESLLTETN